MLDLALVCIGCLELFESVTEGKLGGFDDKVGGISHGGMRSRR